jgi:hypothetical protein
MITALGWAIPLAEEEIRRRAEEVPGPSDAPHAMGGEVEELLLPLADLDGVDLVRLSELGDDLGLLGILQGAPALEGGRVTLACAGQDAPRDRTATFD